VASVRNRFTGARASKPIPIGHRVEHVRAERGVSRSKLALDLGLDRSTVTKWATDGTTPRDLNAVAAALGVDPSAFFAPDVTEALSGKRTKRAAA
jgi:transcriptional regulator with XRE-family HTH domain